MNIIGRLTKDADVRTTSQDKKVVNFSMAINDSYRNKQGEKVVQTTYFDCSYWLAPAIANYLTKGTLVEVEGRVGVNAWLNKEGEAKANLTLHVNQIKFHGGKGQATREEKLAEKTTSPQAEKVSDDLPF